MADRPVLVSRPPCRKTVRPDSRHRRLGVFLLALAASFSLRSSGAADPADQRTALKPPSKDGYAGSQACAGCHQGIYQQFSATHMGRSLTRITPDALAALPLPRSIYDQKLDRHFEVLVRDGKLYQSEYATAPDGGDIFRNTHEVRWIIGSGMNGYGGLVKQEDFLFQAPLSFYSQAKSWGPSPGYEFGDYGFNRPILPGCITCHSGRPNAIPDANGKFGNPEFAEMAIGCENCHGPGAAHIRAVQDGSDDMHLIVNPAHLTAALANDICMSCHQTGDLRVLQPGKTYRDFLPGAPLDDTLAILMVPPKPDAPPQADHLEHYYSMTLSKCYRASAGRMSCISCHDPHVEPSREAAPGFFRQKCLTCHTEKSCGVPLETRQQGHPADDCTGCHMPKRDVQTISHSSVTNHRILTRPDEPFPEAAFHQTTPALPDLIHLNPAAGKKDVPPPPLTLLRTYGELLDTRPEYASRYYATLTELERTAPESMLVQSALGRRDLRDGKLQAALDHLQRATKIGPPQATTYADMSDVLAKLDRSGEALAAIRQSIALDPFNPLSQKSLIVLLIKMKDYAEARKALEHYLEVFPQDGFMRSMLSRANGGGQQ